MEQKIIDAFEAAIPPESQLTSSQLSEQNPLQDSSKASRARNAKEQSSVFGADDLDRMMDKNKVLSAQKTLEPEVRRQVANDSKANNPMSESPKHNPMTNEQENAAVNRFRTDQKPIEKR